MTRKIRTILSAALLAVCAAGTLAGPALADGWHGDRAWRAHAWRAPYRPPVAVAPLVAYGAPAYVTPAYPYIAPPPVAYAAPAASLSVTIPFAIR